MPSYLDKIKERAKNAPKASDEVMAIRLANRPEQHGGPVRSEIGDRYNALSDEAKKQFQLASGDEQDTIARSIAPRTVAPSPTAVSSGTANANNYIEQLMNARRAQQMAQLDKSKNAALSNLSAEKATIQPMYYDKKNQTAAGSQQSARNFAEFMAARGGARSGTGAQAEIMRQGNLQSNVGALNRQEQSAFDDIARRTTQTENAYQSDRASLEAGLQAAKMEALINQRNQDRQFGLQEDQFDLQRDRFEHEIDPSNPQFQAQNLQNQINQLKLKNLPKQMELELQQLQQRVDAGDIDLQTAQYQLEQMTDPNSILNQSKQLSLEAARLGNSDLMKRIEQIGKEPALTPYEQQLQQVKLQTAQEQLKQLQASSTQTGSAEDYYDIINDSQYVAPLLEPNPIPGYDPIDTGRIQVTNQEGLESFILSLGLPDNETMKLYRYYNLPIPQ